MPRLKPNMVACLSEKAVVKLSSLNIKTVVDFVMEDPEKLAVKVKSVLSYKDILSVRRVLLAQYSATVLHGSHLHDDVIQSVAILPTGCTSLDDMLGGGFFTGEITEVVGDAGSGKTQICLHTAAQVCSVNQQNVIYIDTGGNFDPIRMNTMLETRNLSEQEIESALQRIYCHHAFDIFELQEILSEIQASCQKQSDEFYSALRLIVVDCVASVISPQLGATSSGGHGYMMHIARTLKSLAAECAVAVLVTNNTVGGDGNSSRAALGRTWQYVASTRLEVYPSQDLYMSSDGELKIGANQCKHVVRLEKSTRQGSGAEATFLVSDLGLT